MAVGLDEIHLLFAVASRFRRVLLHLLLHFGRFARVRHRHAGIRLGADSFARVVQQLGQPKRRVKIDPRAQVARISRDFRDSYLGFW